MPHLQHNPSSLDVVRELNESDPLPDEATAFQIVQADVLIAEAPSFDAAMKARTLLAREMRLHDSHLVVLYPPDFRVQVLGGQTMSAREIGLPLVTR